MGFREEYEFVLNQNSYPALHEQENNKMYLFDYQLFEYIQLANHRFCFLHAKVQLLKYRQVIHLFQYQIDLR
jgi:hypothetical protein